MNFGDKIRSLRIQAGLTQEELADKCGMKKQNISRYETSDREPNIRTAKKIAVALSVSLEDILNTEFSSSSRESLKPDYSESELHLIQLYRRADEIDRTTIKNILSRYEEEGSATSAG